MPSAHLDESLTLRVAGMTCASCVATIEKALHAVPGVNSAVVNLATGTARVHVTAGVPHSALVEAVDRAGYKVREAEVSTLAEGEPRAETLRLAVCALLTIPLVALAMGPHLFPPEAGVEGAMEPGAMGGMQGMNGMRGAGGMPAAPASPGMAMGDSGWVQFALATPVVLVGGAPFFRGAWKALRNRALTMDVLVATGIGTAYSYSAAIFLLPSWAPAPGIYFETAAVIVTLLLLGRRIERGARRRARAILQGVSGPPASAVVASLDNVSAGPGRPVPDGDGASQLARIVEETQASYVPIQRAVDRVVRYFVPVVLVVAVASFAFWMTLGAPAAMQAGLAPQSMAVLSFVAVLIIACPCALGLATPMAVLMGTTRGAERGLIFKGGEALEASRRIDTVVLGKTGILTTGRLEVTNVMPIQLPKRELLALAGAAEAKSSHPLGIAIHRRAQAASTVLPVASRFQDVPGRGVRATIAGKAVMVGEPEWLAEEGVEGAEQVRLRAKVKRLRAQGKTVTGVALDGRLVGLIAVADPVRPTSRRAVALLRERGLQVVLLAEEHPDVAHSFGASLGIPRVVTGSLPADRAATIRHLKAEGRRVAVVGDGIQDAGALAEAHLGIAMGGGNGLADEAGGIILLKDDPMDVVAALDLARHTLRNVHQNLALAFAYNILLIPVAAGLLVAWPIFATPLQLDPMFAAVAMTLSIPSVILNSFRLRRWRPAERSGAAAATSADRMGFHLEATSGLRTGDLPLVRGR